jgi:glycosyltransferase involved in cell wall biosynthesis
VEPELSVVVLAYRAEEHAGDVIVPLYELLEADGVPYELVVVANYWSRDDRTPVVAAELARDRATILVCAERKRGAMGWDMRSGLAVARGRYLVVIDGDGQVPVEYALDAYRQLTTTGVGVVKGRRFLREDGSVRTLTSLGFNVIFRLLFRTSGLWDINGRPKGMTREAWERLDLRTDDWFTDAEILLKARRLGLPVREFPVRFLANPVRASFVGPGTIWEFLRNMTLTRLGLHPAFVPRRAPQAAPSQAGADAISAQGRHVAASGPPHGPR